MPPQIQFPSYGSDINHETPALSIRNGFLFTRHFRIHMQLKAKAILSCLVEWFIYGTLKLWNFRNFEICSKNDPKENVGCFRQCLFSNNECVVVNKAFKQVAEKQTKIKPVKRQLKASGSFSTRNDIFFRLLMLTLCQFVFKQKKISLRTENSAWWKMALRMWQ